MGGEPAQCRRASEVALAFHSQSGFLTKRGTPLRGEDAGPAASALERLIDLASEAHVYDWLGRSR